MGSCVGLGNTVGPFLAAAFVQNSTWRGLFWCICPLAILSGIMVSWVLPRSKVHGSTATKIRVIDYSGIVLVTAAIMLILIPVSGGGTYFKWSSPMVISMLTLGGACSIAFLIVEWKFAVMPLMPLHLYKNPAVAAILLQNFLFGIVYYSHLYYLPIYYQNARQYTPLMSAALTIPFVATQSGFSVISGQYISRTKRYGEIIWIGHILWALGSGLVLLFSRSFAKWKIVLILISEGAGVGFVYQPSLVAAQAHCTKRDRAVVISTRSFLRALGGAIGLAISSAIFSNSISNHLNSLKTPLPDDFKNKILDSVSSIPSLSTLTDDQKNEVLDVYMAASKSVFYLWAPVMGVCLCLCFLIKDRGLQRPDEKPVVRVQEEEEESGSGSGTGSEILVDMRGDNTRDLESDMMEKSVDVGETRTKY